MNPSIPDQAAAIITEIRRLELEWKKAEANCLKFRAKANHFYKLVVIQKQALEIFLAEKGIAYKQKYAHCLCGCGNPVEQQGQMTRLCRLRRHYTPPEG